jgi:uncharacterized protein (DUF4415 family)
MASVYRRADQLGRGKIDRKRVTRMSEEEIMRTSPPELANLPDDFWDDAVVVEPILKQPISIRIDEDVLAWFRQSGRRYQTRMNAVLRRYMERMQRDNRETTERKQRNNRGRAS